MVSFRIWASMLTLAVAAADRPQYIRGDRPTGLGPRQLKSKKGGKGGSKNSGGGGSGGGGGGGDRTEPIFDRNGYSITPSGLRELHDCAAWESTAIQTMVAAGGSDSECLAQNGCGGGCCRMFHTLVCDEANDFDHLQCICNGNTYFNNFSPPIDIPIGVGNSTGDDDGAGDGDDDGLDRDGENPDGPDIDPVFPEQCNSTERHGFNEGVHPSDTSSLPADLAPGDCTDSSHCVVYGKPLVCCLRDSCLCGESPGNIYEDCVF